MMYWQCGRFHISLDTPKVMGIVNLTPDSFSDGGTYSASTDAALRHAERLVREGADILDVGGESSRPGADYVSPDEEWQRVASILRELATWNIPVSLDTRRTFVMHRALDAGTADAINDIAALRDEGALSLLAGVSDIGVCLMHMQGLPETMQRDPHYHDVAAEVRTFLAERVGACEAAGIARERLLLDPGIGFGKTVAHNLSLLRTPSAWLPAADLPYLIGVSRKSLLGALINEPDPQARVTASVAAAIESVRRGAHIVRVHDVKASCQALKIYAAYAGQDA